MTMSSGIRLSVAAGVAWALTAGSAFALPPPVQTFYVPMPETHTYAMFEAINSATTTNIRNVISIAPNATNTIVIYDHFEDGYEADLNAPTQTTTRIWGDNNPANGIPPGFTVDLIYGGKVIALQSTISVPHNLATLIYDGQDKFSSTKAVAVTYSCWPVSPGAVLADAIEVYDTSSWGTNFISPVGTNVAPASQFFEYTGFSIMAGQAATVVRVDKNADGLFEITNTLNAGQAMLVETGIVAGAQIRSSKPVQAAMLTGDINSSYECRWFSMTPVEDWCFCGVVPVTTTSAAHPLNVFLYNQYTHGITVDVTTVSGTTSFTVTPKSVYRYAVPAGTGARMLIQGQNPAAPTKFYTAVAIMDADNANNQDYDWGFTVPTLRSLTSQALVGWGPGADTNSPSYTGTENGSPVWAVAISNTTLYADYDANPATGPLVDPNGNRYNVKTNVVAFQSVRFFDSSDRDQSGMRVYTVDRTPIAVAWGEDPANASAGNPYLDMGTTVPALAVFDGSKAYSLVGGDGDSLVEPGDTIEYSLSLVNEGFLALENVSLVDPLPPNVFYVAGSTKVNGAAAPDDGSGTPFPLDPPGLTNLPNVGSFSNLTVSFRVTITNPFPQNVSTITNSGTFFMADGQLTVGTETPVVQADLQLLKSVSNPFPYLGSNILYSITLTNRGPSTATGVTVRDLLPAGVAYVSHGGGTYVPGTGIWTVGTLNVGAVATLQITAVVQASGLITNAAQVWTANQFDPDSTPGNSVTNEDDYGTAVIQSVAPAIALVKTAGSTLNGGTNYTVSGSPVVYTYRVVNSGTTYLTNVVVTDDKLGAVGVLAGPIAPGATNFLYATNLGVLASVTNIGTARGAPTQANGSPLPGIGNVQASDNAVVVLMRPEIHMHKAATNPTNGPVHVPDGFVYYTLPGSNVLYVYHIHNLGDTALTNITVTDDKLGFIGVIPFLATNAAGYLFATNYNLTNYVLNVGTATGIPAFSNGVPIPGLSPVVHTDTAIADVASPGVKVIKTAGNAADGDPLYVLSGSNVVYTYQITISGDSWLTNVTAVDNVLGLVGVLPGPLAPGSVHYLYATNFNVTADVTNRVLVTGYPTNGLPKVTDENVAAVKVVAPGVMIVKTAGTTPDGGTNTILPGASVLYTYRVVNTGDTYLTNIVVTDDKLGLVGAIAGPLAPGATNVLTKTASNVTASVVNIGTAVGVPADANGDPMPGLPPVTDTDDAAVRVVRPAVAIVKTAGAAPDGGTHYVLSGAAVVYTYRVVNTGDTYLTNVVVTDDKLGVVGTLAGVVAPGATNVLYKTNLSVTASVTNIGAVVGTPSSINGAALSGVTNVTASDPAVVRVTRPAIVLVKTAGSTPDGGTNYATSGAAVVYTYRVVNTGDTYLTNVVVTDDKLGSVGSIAGPMAPGATNVLYKTNLSVTASVTNIGTARGTPTLANGASLGLGNVQASDNAIVRLVRPALTLVKTAGATADGGTHYVVSGTPVVYTYRVVNSGDTYLTNVVLTDDKLGAIGAIAGPVAPGATNYLFATNLGVLASVTNLGTAIGTPTQANGAPLPGVGNVQATDNAVVVMKAPKIDLVKTAGNAPDGTVLYVISGSNVVYTYRVINQGDTYLTNVMVADDKLGLVGVIPGPVAPGATNYLYATNLNVTNFVINLGVAAGTPAFSNGQPIPGLATVTHTDTAITDPRRPGIVLLKTAGNAGDGETLFVLPGSPVVYTYQIMVTGDTALTNVTVMDDKLGLVGVMAGPVFPGSTNYFYKTNLNVTASVTNVAVVTGYPTNGLPAVTDDHAAFVKTVSPGVSIVKTAGTAPDGGTAYVVSGGSVVYTYRVVNTGDTSLTNVVVTDDKLGLVGVLAGPIAPGATNFLQKSALGMTGDVINVGTAIGVPTDANGHPLPGIPNVSASDNALVDVVHPALVLVKTAGSTPDGGIDYVLAGAAVVYTYRVDNTGDTYLTNVLVTDDKLGVVGMIAGAMAPGATQYLYATNPAVAASVTNLGTAVGVPASSAGTPLVEVAPVTDSDEAIVAVVGPGITIVKTAGSAPDGAVLTVRIGTDVVYTYAVANSGDTYLTNVVVTDDVLGLVGVIPGPVAPGWSTNLTRVHTNLMADVVNVAVASGTPALGSGQPIMGLADVSAQDDADTRIAFFTLTKEDTPDPVRPGKALTYTLWVANPSPNPVTGVVVTENYPPFFSYVSSAPAPASGNNVWNLGTLAPGQLVAIVINGTVTGGAASGNVLTNVVTAVSDNAGTNTAKETTLVTGPPGPGQTEIKVTKRDHADPVQPGSPLIYTIRVENFGPVTATNVVVTDTYDPLFAFITSSPAPNAGTSNVWSLGNLPANTFVEVMVSGQVSLLATNGYVVLNTVVARAVNAAQSQDEELTLVGTIPPPEIVKTASENPVQGGQMMSYTITVANVSQSAIISNVTVVESYDPNFLYQSSVPAPMPGTINAWYLGDLPQGYSTNIVITGKVSKKALQADVLFNTAEVFSDSGSRTVHLVTRVINDPPIPVTLLSFRAVTVPGGVKLKWETATEFENLGFNLYRAASAAGNRTKVNAILVAGSDSSDGAAYKFLDTTARPGKTYYYWLEEVAWNLKTTTYGPAIRVGAAKTGALAGLSPTTVGIFNSASTGGLYRITYETLAANGFAPGALDLETLAVRVNGRPAALFVSAEGAALQPGDFLLFYVPASKRGLACQVTAEKQPARMELADARPSHKTGDVYVDQAGADQRVKFTTDPAVTRYFLHDFAGLPVWLVDITDPAKAVLLAGYSSAEIDNGLTAVYLSYRPAAGPATCLAIQDGAVIEIRRLSSPVRTGP
jgi:uncharacterized repeat protein (TIGR01451 family)